MKNLKIIFRLVFRPFIFLFVYQFKKNKINVSRNGTPLKNGISAVVAMKNEEYTLPFCLESLIGFADQIIIIDNGSEDSSLSIAQSFKEKHSLKIEIDIIVLPGALLGECREAGLNATKYQWHLRWDADMIAQTDGEFDMKKLREKILKDNTPRTIQLPRINLSGDLRHVAKGKDWDVGEPILMWFNKDIYYKEYGKFDTIKVPKYYLLKKERVNYYFHCEGLKADENLIHRFHYFRWREKYNLYKDKQRPSNIESYIEFVKERNMFLFDTTEVCKIKYRYQRQCVQNFEKMNVTKFGKYPKVLRDEIEKKDQRFEIIYVDNKIYTRIDRMDQQMLNFIPDNEDLMWSTDEFFNKILIEK
jgi:glycosyltransferase involved in cell wall biosynthesis